MIHLKCCKKFPQPKLLNQAGKPRKQRGSSRRQGSYSQSLPHKVGKRIFQGKTRLVVITENHKAVESSM